MQEGKLKFMLRGVLLLLAVFFLGWIIAKGPDLGTGSLRGNWLGLLAWLLTMFVMLYTSVKVLFGFYEEPGQIKYGLMYWVASLFMGQKKVQIIFPDGRKLVVKPDGPLASIFAKLDAPGILIIENGAAVILERSGRLTRIHGPGIAFTLEFEKIAEVIDLRPKIAECNIDNIQTKDGFIFSLRPIYATYQIATGFNRRDGKYTYNESDIIRLYYEGGFLHSRERTVDTEKRVLGLLEYYTRNVANEKTINQIARLNRAGDSRTEMIQQLEEACQPVLLEYGIHLTGIDIGRILLPPEFTQRRAIRETGESLSQVITLIQKSMADVQHVAPHVAINMADNLERLAQEAVRLATVFEQGPTTAQLPPEEDTEKRKGK